MIESPRLKLIPFTETQVDAIVSGNLNKLAKILEAEVSSNWQAFEGSPAAAEYFYQMLKEQAGDTRFGGYFVIFKADQNLIGTAGYKGKTKFPHSVEIGYEIQGEYQKLGLATEAARAMIDFAFREGVKSVTAQTLPDGIASHRVLQKNGFQRTGEVKDQEHGLLWEWVLPAPTQV